MNTSSLAGHSGQPAHFWREILLLFLRFGFLFFFFFVDGGGGEGGGCDSFGGRQRHAHSAH